MPSGWTNDLRWLVGSELSTDKSGQVFCDNSPVHRVRVYRVETASRYLDLEAGCDEGDLSALHVDDDRYHSWLKSGESITFYFGKGAELGATKSDKTKSITWVDHGGRVLEFAVIRIGPKSELPNAPPLRELSDLPCSGPIAPPLVLIKSELSYPNQSRTAKIQGTVVVSLLVDAKGMPTHEKVVKSVAKDLDQSALETARKWRFRPAMCDGHPTSVRVELEFNFR